MYISLVMHVQLTSLNSEVRNDVGSKRIETLVIYSWFLEGPSLTES